MSSRRRGYESGFIGQNNPNINDSGYDEVYAGDIGDNNAGFTGMANNNGNNHLSGFEGLNGNNRQPDNARDYVNLDSGKKEPQRHNQFPSRDFPPAPKRNNTRRPKPVEKPLTHVDKDTVNKVVDLKDKFQKIKDRSKDKERELNVLNMKIEALAERIKDIDNKKSEFKDQLFEEK